MRSRPTSGSPRTSSPTAWRPRSPRASSRRRLYQQRPERHEYRLTEKGADLIPALLALMQWGDRWTWPRRARPGARRARRLRPRRARRGSLPALRARGRGGRAASQAARRCRAGTRRARPRRRLRSAAAGQRRWYSAGGLTICRTRSTSVWWLVLLVVLDDLGEADVESVGELEDYSEGEVDLAALAGASPAAGSMPCRRIARPPILGVPWLVWRRCGRPAHALSARSSRRGSC